MLRRKIQKNCNNH